MLEFTLFYNRFVAIDANANQNRTPSNRELLKRIII